jgi:hypothetical protein
MSDSNAAGRKTENQAQRPDGYAHHADSLLGMMTGGVRESLERANRFDQQNDDHGHRRQSEVENAIKLGTLGMDLVVALGKMEATREK